jgi:hypothetical protein
MSSLPERPRRTFISRTFDRVVTGAISIMRHSRSFAIVPGIIDEEQQYHNPPLLSHKHGHASGNFCGSRVENPVITDVCKHIVSVPGGTQLDNVVMLDACKKIVNLLPDCACIIDYKGFVICGNTEFDETLRTKSSDVDHRRNILCTLESDMVRFFAALKLAYMNAPSKQQVNDCLTTVLHKGGSDMDVFFDWAISVDESRSIILVMGR